MLSPRQWGSLHRRWQYLLLVALGLLVLNLTAWALSDRLVLDSFLALERTAVEDAVANVQGNLALESQYLQRRAHDNADRDETYQMLLKLQAGVGKSLHVPRFFRPSRHVASALVDLRGRVLFLNPQGPNLPPGLETQLPRLVHMLAKAGDHEGRGGLVRTPEGVVLVGLGPVLPESGRGTVQAMLVFARRLDAEGLRKFRERLQLDFHLEDLGPNDSDMADAAGSPTIQFLEQDSLRGVLPLSELFGYGGLRLVVTLSRTISRQGERAVAAFRGSILAASLLFSVLALWLLNRIQVGQERRAERDRLIKNLLDRSGEGVLLVAADSGQLLSVNPRGARMFGLASGTTRLPSVEEVFRSADGISYWQQILGDILGDRQGLTTTLQRSDGSLLDLEVGGSVLDQERKRYLLLVCRDISRQKATEQELLAAARRYRTLFESSPLPMWVYDNATRRCLDVNPAALAKYGYSREEFLGLSLEDLHLAEEVPQLLSRLGQDGGRGDYAGLWPQQNKRGERLEVEVACHGVDSFSAPATLVLANDVTQRRQSQRELLAAKQRFEFLSEEYRTVVETIPDQLSLIAPDLTVVWSNRPSAQQEESAAVSTTGHHRCTLDEAECLVRRCLASGRPQEGRETTGEGHLWSVRVFPLHRSSGELAGAIRLASEETEKVRLQQEAAQVSRLAAIGELAAGVAHEINNPNGMILLNSRLVDDVFGDALPLLEAAWREDEELTLGGLSFAMVREEVPQALVEIQRGARKIRSIVEDLKNFARSDQPRAQEPVDLRAVVEAAIRLTANAQKKAGAQLKTSIAEPLPELRGSFQRLEQVVINLLLNACQALSEAGRIIAIELRHEPAAGTVVLQVRDRGVGIAAKDLGQIFDPFFTTKRETGGTGLGLSVSERIAREHGGTLTLASTPGVGTTATLTLPVVFEEKDEQR